MTDQPARDPMLDTLTNMYVALDPMPTDLVPKVLAALAAEDLDAEYELLDIVERSRQLAGVRGKEALTIEFSNGTFSVLLYVRDVDGTQRRVDGWVAPAQPLRVRIDQGEKRHEAAVGRLGRFEFKTLPAGMSRLWISAPDGDDNAERLFATPTFEI